jgi:methyl-accepting chemotaxis protein
MLQRLKLGTQFTIVLSIVFLCSSLLSYGILSQVQRNTAERTVTEQAMVMMNTLNSLRSHHANEVLPWMTVENDTLAEFVPETVPSYVVRQVFEQFRQKEEFKRYLYKDATLNPTNPRDQADDFETDLIAQFKLDENLDEIHGFRTLEGELLFYTARPFMITDASCLDCHSTPEAAPKNLITTYGDQNGFGWNLNEILATQIIYLPARQIFQAARRNTRLAVAIFMAIFAVVLLIVNKLIKHAIVEPLQPMARVAKQFSEESSSTLDSSAEASEQEFKKLNKIANQGDELGQLARIFQRMAKVVYSREQDLRQQLQNVLNEAQQQERDSQDIKVYKVYIQNLLARSRQIRQQTLPDKEQ